VFLRSVSTIFLSCYLVSSHFDGSSFSVKPQRLAHISARIIVCLSSQPPVVYIHEEFLVKMEWNRCRYER